MYILNIILIYLIFITFRTLDDCVFHKDDLNFEPLNKLEKLTEM